MINKMLKNKKYGFTLVELLAVIVILAVILVIAVPKMINIINDSKKSTFSNSVKLIASRAEQKYAENKTLGKNDKITCKGITKLSSSEYKLCEISFEQEKARVTVIGDGKFEGLSVVYATKTNAEVQEGAPERLYTFDEVYSLIDDMNDTINELKSKLDSKSDKIDCELKTEQISELQNQINEINNKVNKNSTDISDVITKANSNATSISNLTNKENSNNIFLQNYPVGSIYVSEKNVNPGTKFGGTWVSYGAGRTLVGVDSSQTEFATVGITGGEKTHTLTISEMPSHNHGIETNGEFTIGNGGGSGISGIPAGVSGWGSYSNAHWYSISVRSTGSSKAHNNLQPYITVYMWKRTA